MNKEIAKIKSIVGQLQIIEDKIKNDLQSNIKKANAEKLTTSVYLLSVVDNAKSLLKKIN